MRSEQSASSTSKTLKSADMPSAVDICRPESRSYGLVFGLPHSGTYLPQDFVEGSHFDAVGLRATEDAFVDDLVGFDTLKDVWALRANYGRSFVDVNRHPLELDPRLIKGTLPRGNLSHSLRVKSGYGVIPRCLSGQREINRQPIDYKEAIHRLARVHTPYHHALKTLLAEAMAAHGRVTLIDWHSMPSAALKKDSTSRLPDMVLGDLHGETCAPELTVLVKARLEAHGFKVALNHPFAGGYVLERYADRHKGVEALQIEINRALYMSETDLTLKPEYEAVKGALKDVIEALKAR